MTRGHHGATIARMEEQENRAIGRFSTACEPTSPDVPAETVSTAVQAAQAELAGHPIRDFVPVLIERNARSGSVKRMALDQLTATVGQ